MVLVCKEKHSLGYSEYPVTQELAKHILQSVFACGWSSISCSGTQEFIHRTCSQELTRKSVLKSCWLHNRSSAGILHPLGLGMEGVNYDIRIADCLHIRPRLLDSNAILMRKNKTCS